MSEEKEITIYDIAKHLNISATTVSRGLKDHPTINIKTRKKIAEAARQLGYRSNTFASSLRSKRTQTLGVIVPRLNSNFMSSVLAGMENAASREGYNLIIAQSLEKADKEMENAHTMFNKRVDGLMVSLAYGSESLQHFDDFFQKKIPVIFFDRVSAHPESTSIVIDNYAAAYQVTQHLIEQGCRRILHLGGNLLLSVYSERLRGYKQALLDHKIGFDDKLVMTGNLTEDFGTAAAAHLLKLKPKERPDAVFSANDTAAVYCMIAVKAAGISIPHDIAFAGFNNDPISKVIEPNLTTVNYPGYNMGQAAVTSLANHLNGETSIINTNTIVLRSELIIRDSSQKNNSI
ncbi:LacI family DNA-binding transcriptional regulator [Chitinophaga sp. Cy-1792]|uniref:LacI family DNA-binding transcriptional regulator n=1 Tax=Chitinophaga sp. Cy-1792 TaxID=2608339 RepID=UPI001420D89D|nr:LacI family DNA-binding transcriptional regulator [Chitinophaga sp. Cy-1792]NIG55992.1 LacI family transcriptional regulator [Chitinophaga sp. Cy-1792]